MKMITADGKKLLLEDPISARILLATSACTVLVAHYVTVLDIPSSKFYRVC
jgi:hypothetical protein